MVNRRISPDLKECALRMWNLGWDRADICYTFRVSQASLYRWKAIFDEFGQVTNPPSGLRGRPRMIGLAALTACKEVYRHNSDTYLDELQWFLAVHHDIVISIPALHENLQKAGLTRKLLRKIAIERDYALRQSYSTTIKTQFSGTGREFITPFVRGTRYTLVGALSSTGFIAARVVEGSLDSEGFFDFITEEVVPKMNPYPDDHSVLIMDNCRIHHTDTLLDALN
ncbi:hypothetical protein K435DRAFT_592083, partial [Dendrothele bispora CBS 962.96]